MHVQARGVAVATVGQRALLVQHVAAFHADLVGLQVLEVERVADVGVVHLGHQAFVQATLVLPVDHPALVFVVRLVFAVVVLVVQVRAAELAFAGLGQVAEFAFHQQAALGHVARVQRGVVVRRQVEVVRRDQHEAGVAAAAERRWQEAGLATIVDREVDVRCVEHREILDPQGDVGRGAEAGGRVQGDVVALQLPGVAARFAGGVRTVLEADDGVFATLGVQGAAADMRLVHHVFGVVDLGFARVELNLCLVTDYQRAVVTDLDVAFELATVFGLVQVGLVRFGLHAALAHDHVTGEGSDLLLLLVLGHLGIDVGRRLILGRGVGHAWASWLDVGATAVRAGFGQLCGSELFTRHPVEVAVVFAARLQAAAFGLGDQHRPVRSFASARGFGAAADGGTFVHRAWRQVAGWGLGLAVPAAGGGHLAVKLLGCHHVRCGQRLQGQQTAGDQQRKLSTKRGGFQCHLISPGFLRAICPRVGPHASRWSEKDAG